ncbi:MAG: YoaH family protein [Arsenophonus sp.]
MFSDMPTLNHQEQQEAIEDIYQLMTKGMNSEEHISLLTKKIELLVNLVHAAHGKVDTFYFYAS